jgi:flavorubredoxin
MFNKKTICEKTVYELAPGVFRISLCHDGGFIFSQFLITGEEAILIHTGRRSWFDESISLISEVIDPKTVNYIGVSHLEADECGALGKWLELNSTIKPLVSPLNVSNIEDIFDCTAISATAKKTLSLGGRDLQIIPTPHFSHGWEGCLFYLPVEKILFTSDFGAHLGGLNEVITTEDRSEQIFKFQQKTGFMVEGASFRAGIAEIKKLDFEVMAPMHGSALKGEWISGMLERALELFG